MLLAGMFLLYQTVIKQSKMMVSVLTCLIPCVHCLLLLLFVCSSLITTVRWKCQPLWQMLPPSFKAARSPYSFSVRADPYARWTSAGCSGAGGGAGGDALVIIGKVLQGHTSDRLVSILWTSVHSVCCVWLSALGGRPGQLYCFYFIYFLL